MPKLPDGVIRLIRIGKSGALYLRIPKKIGTKLLYDEGMQFTLSVDEATGVLTYTPKFYMTPGVQAAAQVGDRVQRDKERVRRGIDEGVALLEGASAEVGDFFKQASE